MMYNILIAGVGGQGSLLASRILGRVYTGKGLDVKVSEVHGMSQRGGSVVTYVRAGESVASPLITPGEADLLIAFEELEGFRWLHYLKKSGKCVINTQRIAPMPVITGAAVYPEGIGGAVAKDFPDALVFNALPLAEAAGSAKAVNIVMLGAASAILGFSDADWDGALRACVPEKFLDMNIRAFDSGKKAAAERNG